MDIDRTLSKIVSFLRDQPVLCIAALAALVSMVVVPPCDAYRDYIDWRVLGLLFCLMLCVKGLQEGGIFARIAHGLLRGAPSTRFAATALVLLCFFSSMLVTNDVALLTFVPFALYLFTVSNQQSKLALVVVLQTIAANLGSMLTPMGNPQNLFLFSHFNLTMSDFFTCIAPFAGLALGLLIVCSVAFSGPTTLSTKPDSSNAVRFDLSRTLVFGALFVASVLTVFNVIPLVATLAASIVITLIISRSTLAKVDYGLLATFVCFFVFSGNLANIGPIREALVGLMQQAPFASSLVASQVISNVPAATLLAPFTSAWPQLLLGVDIGGLGTPVASLASLISLELYRRAHVGSTSHFLAIFAAFNLVFLVAEVALGCAIGSF